MIFLVTNLILQAVLLSAVLFYLGVDVLHQSVSLHQHVSEGGAGEDSHNLDKIQTCKHYK